jgi:putative membrane protein
MLNTRTGLTAVTIVGALLATALAARAGLPAIVDALMDLGWLGLVWVCVLQMVSLVLCAAGWWVVADGASFSACLTARWVRDGASNLVSILPGIGEVAGARALRLFGAGAGAAAASTVIDIATESLSQAIYTVIGVIPLLGFLDRSEATHWLGALAVATVPVLAVYLVTRHRGALALVEKLIVRAARAFGLAEAAGELNMAQNVRRLYGNHRRIAASTLIHLAAWFMGAVQVWAAAKAMGIELSPGAALALESLVYAARGAFFMVPWGAGIQEASFVLVGAILGVDEAGAMALSLALRARDVLLGVPAVLLWSAAEGRETWLKSASARRD